MSLSSIWMESWIIVEIKAISFVKLHVYVVGTLRQVKTRTVQWNCFNLQRKPKIKSRFYSDSTIYWAFNNWLLFIIFMIPWKFGTRCVQNLLYVLNLSTFFCYQNMIIEPMEIFSFQKLSCLRIWVLGQRIRKLMC